MFSRPTAQWSMWDLLHHHHEKFSLLRYSPHLLSSIHLPFQLLIPTASRKSTWDVNFCRLCKNWLASWLTIGFYVELIRPLNLKVVFHYSQISSAVQKFNLIFILIAFQVMRVFLLLQKLWKSLIVLFLKCYSNVCW